MQHAFKPFQNSEGDHMQACLKHVLHSKAASGAAALLAVWAQPAPVLPQNHR